MKELIKQKATELGFSACGISKADFLEEEESRLTTWIHEGNHADMEYLAKNTDLRLDPRLLVDGAKSVISLAYNYYQEIRQPENAPSIALYAWGEDYHLVVKDKLNQLFSYIQCLIKDVNGRCFTDSAPVMERVWAQRAGIAFIGKNGLAILPGKGSYFFLGEIILDAKLEYDNVSLANKCGSCTRCIDSCPTNAIIASGKIDARKCISYLTIENKGSIDELNKAKLHNTIFGCDICQQVCPWNRFASSHSEPRFIPSEELLQMKKEDWLGLDEDKFRSLFRKSSVKRSKFKGLMRNINFLYG